jgi:hypothetical protein
MQKAKLSEHEWDEIVGVLSETDNQNAISILAACVEIESTQEPKTIELELETEVLVTLALNAHNLDLTLNEYIQKLLERYLEQHGQSNT